jgi:ATP-dependent DNA helicase RecG
MLEVDRALAELLAGRRAANLEGQTLDFKLATGPVKSVFVRSADAVVCFANADGGHVVLGVDDTASGRSALSGVPDTISVDALRKGIFERTAPPITAFVSERFIEGVRIVVITVPPGVLPHSNAAGLSTRRLNDECLPFPPDQQRELMIARGQLDWSAAATDIGPRQLSPVEFGRLRSLLVAAGRNHLSELDDLALLRALRLLAADQSVTNAGLLLFADEAILRRVLPAHSYSYQYRPSAGREATAHFRGYLPLLAAIESLMQAVDNRQDIHPLNVSGGVQLQLADYPHNAVRELVVNGLIHRSYETHGSVDIEHSPEHLAITSPGSLVSGVTPDNILTHPSTPRNRLLTEAVAAMGIAERTGQGVDRAYREMLRAGKQPPAFEDHGTLVRARLTGGVGNDAFVRFVSDLPSSAAKDVNVLLTLSALRQHASIGAAKLSSVLQRPAAESQDVLATMDREFGLVEATRRTAGKSTPNYRLRSEVLTAMSRAVTYHRRGTDDLDQKIIDHVREYGSVSNRTLQRMFDIHVFAARDLIADLRARRILTKIGDARGGTNVRYGPGERFPS